MASVQQAFQPFITATTAVSVSGTTANGLLNMPGAADTSPGGRTVRVHNACSAIVFIKFGTSAAATAATTDLPIPAGGVEVFSIGAETYIAAITASATGTLYATPGYGW